MASGDTLIVWSAYSNEPPSASFATLDTRNQHPVLDFDTSTSETAVFSSVMPRNYAGGGVNINAHVAFSSATAGSGVLNLAFERIGNEVADLDDAAGFATAASMAVDVPPTSGSVAVTTINMTDGAAIDSVAVGEKFRFSVQRDCNNATDNASGDLELVAVELQEL